MNDHASRIRFAVYTTVFGVLWGLAEMFLGTWLKALNMPLKGAVMAAIGAVLLSAGRVYVPRRWSTLSTGLVAAALKMVSFSAFKLGPVSGIMIEALVMEAVFSVFGNGSAAVFWATLLACFEGVPHFFVSNWLVYGGGIFAAYMDAVARIQKMLGFSGDMWLKVLAVWAGAHLVIGALAGAGAAAVAGRIRREA